MSTDTSANPTGTGQQGAGAPAGIQKDIPIHIEGGKTDGIAERAANKAAVKGIDRQHHDDPTEFTK